MNDKESPRLDDLVRVYQDISRNMKGVKRMLLDVMDKTKPLAGDGKTKISTTDASEIRSLTFHVRSSLHEVYDHAVWVEGQCTERLCELLEELRQLKDKKNARSSEELEGEEAVPLAKRRRVEVSTE